MRIIIISDTHGLHNNMEHELPDGDVLIHAGDCTNVGKEREIEEFVYWYQNIKKFDTKIFIAGNHDFGFEKYDGYRNSNESHWLQNLINEENLSQSNVTYLHDSELVIASPEFSRPIKFYGSPWQPEFFNWAFNLPRLGTELELKWADIPNDTDVLITHTPPNGIRDFVRGRFGTESVGCELLRHRVDKLNPILNVFGHIHDAYGAAQIKDTLFVNASICDERYNPINKPMIVDLKEIDGKIIAEYVNQ